MGICVADLWKRVGTRIVEEFMRQNKYRRGEGRTGTKTTARQGPELNRAGREALSDLAQPMRNEVSSGPGTSRSSSSFFTG